MVVTEIMIAAVVLTSAFDRQGIRYWPEGEIEHWCVEMLGTKAEFRDQVSEEYPWAYYYSNGLATWYFAREEYATMFRLKFL